jgi:hypothetical protein
MFQFNTEGISQTFRKLFAVEHESEEKKMAACRMTLEKVVQVEGVEVSLDALWTTPEGHTTYPCTPLSI